MHSPVHSGPAGRARGQCTSSGTAETAARTSRLGRQERAKLGLLDSSVAQTTISAVRASRVQGDSNTTLPVSYRGTEQ